MTKQQQQHEPIPGGVPDVEPLDHPALHAEAPQREDAHLHGLNAIPKGMGFKRYKHRGRPGKVGDVRLVLVQTDRGWATSGPRPIHEEEWALAEGEMGAIVAYGKAIKVVRSSRFEYVPFPKQRVAQA